MPRGVPRVPEPREWVLVKRCSKCGETKPWALFSPARYWPDGSVRHVVARCRACEAERRNDPARRAGYRERNAQRLRDYHREWMRARRAALRAEGAGDVMLEVGPFREWLAARALEVGGFQALADCLGEERRTIHRIRTEQRTVGLSIVDRCATALGWHIGEIYDEEEALAA